MHAIPEDNLKYPIRCVFSNGTGSGFLIYKNDDAYFVTAKHVLFDLKKMELHSDTLTLHGYGLAPGFNQEIGFSADLQILNTSNRITPHITKDVAVIKIGEFAKGGRLMCHAGMKALTNVSTPIVGVDHRYVLQYKDVKISNDIYLFGYPSSLGLSKNPQIEFEKPLLRKGIVAGKNDLSKTIIVDCPSYPGNSGGPVLHVERDMSASKTDFQVFGVLTKFVPFTDEFQSKRYGFSNVFIENSGYSIVEPIDAVLELLA